MADEHDNAEAEADAKESEPEAASESEAEAATEASAPVEAPARESRSSMLGLGLGFEGPPDVAADYPPANEQTLRIAGLGCIVLIFGTILSFTWVFGMAFDDLSKLDSRGVEVVTQEEAAADEPEQPGAPAPSAIEGRGWHASFEEGAAVAGAESRPMLLYFEATWAAASQRMHEDVFAVDEVAERMGRYELVRIDMTGRGPEALAVAERYDVTAVPSIVLVRPDGSRLHQGAIRTQLEDVTRALDEGLRVYRAAPNP